MFKHLMKKLPSMNLINHIFSLNDKKKLILNVYMKEILRNLNPKNFSNISHIFSSRICLVIKLEAPRGCKFQSPKS